MSMPIAWSRQLGARNSLGENTAKIDSARIIRKAIRVSEETMSPPGQSLAASCQSLTSGKDNPQNNVTTIRTSVAWPCEPKKWRRGADSRLGRVEEIARAGDCRFSRDGVVYSSDTGKTE